MAVNKNTELRKLRPAEFYNFALILSPSDNWKKLVSVVMKEGNEQVPKFDGETISIIEEASRHERKPAATIFLEEWATMGRKRPTLGLLLNLLMKAELFRAADYLAEEILKIAPPERPTTGPAVPIDVEQALAELLAEQDLNAKQNEVISTVPSGMDLHQIDYPMHILETSDSDNNCLLNNNEIGIIEVRYEQPNSHQAFEQAQSFQTSSQVEESNVYKKNEKSDKFEKNDCSCNESPQISDLMKFSHTSVIDKNSNGYSRSDLIKFDSTNELENGQINGEVCESALPDFTVLRSNSTTENKEEVEAEKSDSSPGIIQELSSRELPVILKEFQTPDYLRRELTTSELPVCINDRAGFQSSESRSSEKNTSVDSALSFGSSVWESNDNYETNDATQPQYEVPKNEFQTQDLPITVLEFQQR